MRGKKTTDEFRERVATEKVERERGEMGPTDAIAKAKARPKAKAKIKQKLS